MTAFAGDPVSWNPRRYLGFAEQRLRPALDLLARIDVADPEIVHDVGCGTGALARVMADRWPAAAVTGSDESPAMLDEARRFPSRVTWRRRDVRRWDADDEVDVVTANSVLHWVPEHDELILRLLSSVRPGGALAIQVPRSWSEPSHVTMRAVLADLGLGSAGLLRRLSVDPVADPAHYHRLLTGTASRLDVWETRYLHALTGVDPVLEWMRGTALRPVLDDLSGDDGNRFVDAFRERLRTVYPADGSGVTRYPFPRLFVVAQR